MDVNNVDSCYLGRHTFRDGDRPQKFRKTPYFLSGIAAHGELVNWDLHKNTVIEGAYYTNRHALQESFMSNEISSSLNDVERGLKMIEDIIPDTIRKLKIEILPPCDFRHCELSRFVEDKYAGFYADKYFGFKNKKDAHGVCKVLSRLRYNEIELSARLGKEFSPTKLIPGTYCIGARNKRDYTFEENEVLKSRVVHMPDYHVEMISAPWTDSISKFIQDKERGPIYIGNNIIKSDRFEKDTRHAKTLIEGDWKRFDNSLPVFLILSAISICRLYFPYSSKRIDAHFKAIFDSLVIKDYVVPGGFIYRLLKTLPSGVKSTSLVGSLVNLIALNFVSGKKRLKRTSFVVGGDDFIISSDIKLGEKDLDKIKERGEKLGMQFKYLEIKKFNSFKSSELPVFYKYSIMNGRPVIPYDSLMERCLMPWNKRYVSKLDLLKFYEDLLPGIGYPCTTNVVFYKIYIDLYNSVYKPKIPLNLVSMYKKHLSVYWGVMRGEISLVKEIGRYFSSNEKEEEINERLRADIRGFTNVGSFKSYKAKFLK